jgi:hypothetical protein
MRVGPSLTRGGSCRQLLSAVRVANAAARMERNRRDRETAERTGSYSAGDVHVFLSRSDLTRALARYTHPQPQQVSQ